MQLAFSNSEDVDSVLGTFVAADWLSVVQKIEEIKDVELTNIKTVYVVDQDTGNHLFWDLAPGKRDSILKDKMFDIPKDEPGLPKKKAKSKKKDGE